MLFFNRTLRHDGPYLNFVNVSDGESRKLLKFGQLKSREFYDKHARRDVRQNFNSGHKIT